MAKGHPDSQGKAVKGTSATAATPYQQETLNGKGRRLMHAPPWVPPAWVGQNWDQQPRFHFFRSSFSSALLECTNLAIAVQPPRKHCLFANLPAPNQLAFKSVSSVTSSYWNSLSSHDWASLTLVTHRSKPQTATTRERSRGVSGVSLKTSFQASHPFFWWR